jgi:hypothetical protein
MAHEEKSQNQCRYEIVENLEDKENEESAKKEELKRWQKVVKQDRNCHLERTRKLFWMAAAATIGHLGLITLDSLSKNISISSLAVVFYFGILSTYAAYRTPMAIRKLGKKYNGHCFVWIVWAYTGLMIIIDALSPGVIKIEIEIPELILNLTFGFVTLLFLGTGVLKILKSFSNDNFNNLKNNF